MGNQIVFTNCPENTLFTLMILVTENIIEDKINIEKDSYILDTRGFSNVFIEIHNKVKNV